MVGSVVNAPCKLAWGGRGIDDRLELLDVQRNEFGRVFGDIRICCKNRGDRFTDIAHTILRQHRLAKWRELLIWSFAKIDRREIGDIVGRPNRDYAGSSARCGRLDILSWPCAEGERTMRMCS